MDDPTLDNLVVSFRGVCQGVGLKQRGPNDPHICYVILTEDDEYWFVSKEQSASSYWMPELMDCFQQAQDWMENHAVKESCGYRFESDDERAAREKKDAEWEKRYNEVNDAWLAWENKEAHQGRGYKGIPSVDAKPLNRAISGKCVVFHINGDSGEYVSPLLTNPTYARLFKCFSDSIAIDEHHCFMEGVYQVDDWKSWPRELRSNPLHHSVKVYRFATGS